MGTINVKEETKKQFNIVRTIMSLSQDKFLKYLMDENPNVKKYTQIEKNFEPVVTKKL